MTQINIDFDKIKTLNSTQRSKLKKMLEPRMNKYMAHYPMPKQAVFMNLTCKEAFYGGAAGGGKSDCLLMDALQYVDQPGYSAVIFRKTYADLVKPGALIDRAKTWLMPFAETGEVHWSEKERKFTWYDTSGRIKLPISTLQFGYLDSENDKYNYQGGEYQFAGFDELTHFSESNYRYIFSRMRRLKGTSIPLKIRGASNPPDEGQGIWVYDRFVNPDTKSKEVIFLPAGLDDNPYVDAESYDEMLNELDPVTRSRLRDGVWTIKRSGNMFKRDWFEIVPHSTIPTHARTMRTWDIAATDPKRSKHKTKDDPDYTVGMKVAEYRGIYYILDIVRFRGRPEEVERMQALTGSTDTTRVIVREEQEPGASGIAIIEHKAKTIYKGYNYVGVRSSGSKIERANIASAAAEKGLIKISENCRYRDELFDELEVFPSTASGIHDDMVDALSLAVKELGSMPDPGIPTFVETPGGSYWQKAMGENVEFRGWRGI